jgi:hypothetical protein
MRSPRRRPAPPRPQQAARTPTLHICPTSSKPPGSRSPATSTAGTDAEVIKSYPLTGGSDFDVTQAFVQYAHGPLTVMAGKFVTLANVEVIAETQDTNFSHSILFGYAVPFTNTGIRAVDAIGDRFSLTLGVNNGWDQITDSNGGKTLEVGLGWTPSKAFSALVNVYVGQQPINYTSRDLNTQRELVDVIVTYSATDRLTLIVNYDRGRQSEAAADGGTASWDGIAGYVNYQWTDRWRSSLRAERFDDARRGRTNPTSPPSSRPAVRRPAARRRATDKNLLRPRLSTNSDGKLADPKLVVDQDRAKIIDVGQRRSGDDRVAQRREKSMTVVVVEHRPRRQAEDPRPRE